MQHPYFEAITLVERLHRQFLDVLKIELERAGIQDINNVQSLILYNIGEDELTVGELTARGYYLGSNVSYNLKKMVENGYLIQERSVHDRRSIRVKLSDKGHEIRTLMNEVFERHIGNVENSGLDLEQLKTVNDALKNLERFLTGQVGYSPLNPIPA
ncbi:MAG: winged helix-turn-helix transcriptional regulator [Alphaproteobacteria bacterium]|nr:winged helix-turn-helix transcriptional regulator [Alphaproteobacteria bacterium SS10]